jgi:hypothetical protein
MNHADHRTLAPFDSVHHQNRVIAKTNLRSGGTIGSIQAMTETPPPIELGPLKISQPKPNDDLTVVHRGKQGDVRVTVPAERLQRWLMRQMREEAFAA